MTTANPSNYWISGNALRITLNANGDADYIQGNTASGAMILCFIKDVSGLGYDAGHNYQRWKLLLSPTYFATKSVKYVYVAIPRAGKKVPQDFAQVVFPSEKLDIYGKNASEQQIGSTDYYYIWLQGIISASEVGGVLQDRVWTEQIQTGTLASDEAYEAGGDNTWWKYSSVSDTVTFLKTIAHAVFERMRVTTRLIFGNSDESENYVSGIANNNTSDTSEHDIVTPAYGKEKFLSRKNNDTASGWITFIKGLRTVIDYVSGATGSGGAFYQEQSGTYSRAHLETDVARIREMLLGSLDVEENLHVGGSETIGTSAAGQNTMADGTTVNNYRQKVGGNARIDGVLVALSKIYSNLLRSQNFNGDGLFDSGFELTKDDGTGHSYLVVDKLYVRLKAIFEALEIRKMIYSGGNFIFSHAGGKVVKVREIREELTASVDGNTLMLTGPVNITGSTLHIDGGARVENGTLVITGESTLYAYRCYFLTDDGTTRTENWWQVDDQARCQTFNIKEGVYEHVSNQSYWRRVLAVGRETLDDGKEYDYIDLSVVDCMSGSTVPKEGDDLVQCGNRTDPERQGFITLEIAGEYAPALKIYKKVNGYTTNGKRKICLSPKYTELIVNKFVQETEYDVQQVPMERGEWELIPGNKCYYYNLVQHNGASWLCIYPEEGVNGVLYTVEEPSENAVWWRPYAQRGKDGEDGKSFNIKGTFDTYAEFDAAEKVYEEGVAYVVAGFLYIYDPLTNNFKNAGQFKGDPGRGINSATISYGVSDSSSVTPNEWKSSPSALALEQGVYLWVRTILVYTDGEQSSPSYNISYFGKDGSFKNTVFCRTNTDISSLQPNGGTWGNPIPNPSSGVVWSDGIPAGESRLWATSAVFSPTGQMSEWTKPKPMTDTTDTDVEFSPSTAKPANPSDVISEREAQGWYDPDRNPSFDFTTTIWRAERHCKNGIWGNWAVERIKGENGDSITIDTQNSKTEYVASNQGTSVPSTGWSTTIPSVPQGQFLWTRVTTVYSDGSSTVSYGVSYNAEDGTPGTSVTITSKSVKYAVTNNGTQPADSSFTYNSIPQSLELGQYLWTKTEVAYSDGNSTKAYSVSRLGTDGAQGIPGPNGKTTHFAYAKMKAGQSIPSTGKITTAMVDSWSRTNFPGADAIGTYDDTTTEDSDNIADYTWTEWKGEKGDKGDSGSSAASVVLDTSVISVPVDTDGYVIDNFHAEVGVRLYVAGKDVVATEISIDEQDGSSLVSAPANALAAMPWATEDDYELNDGQINFKRNASINENTLVLTGDAWAVVPDRLIVEVKKGTLLREHAANLTVGGSDEDKNYIEGFASIAIQRQYVPTNGREGADAVSMMLTKYNVILNQQQSGAKTIPLDDAYTDVMAYVGDMNVTGNAVITATPSKVNNQPVCAVSVSGGRVTITSIGTYKETVDGKEKTYYYDKGEVNIQVSYNGKKYPLVFGFSCNLLGTWKEEVENDTQKIVAQRISYVVNDGDPTKTIEQTKETFTQMSSSVGQVSEWKEEKENVYDGYDQRITNTNTRVSDAESNISTISHTRPQEDIFSKGLSDWVLNDMGYPDANFDNKYPRYYAVGEITDIYSPVVALMAGEYCFSAYVPSDREFDTNGNTIVLMQGCTASDPSSGSFIPASNASTVGSDTITIQVAENGGIVEKTYYRRYATFRITGNEALCSINLCGDGSKFADVVRPKLEVGSSVTPYVMSSSVVKQTADALTVQINGKASHSEVTQTAEQISATITNKLGETGININGDTRSIRLQADTTTIDSDVIVGSLKTKPDANGFFTEINGGENRVAKKNGNTIQDVMRWGVFSIDGSFSNVSSQIFYKDGNPSLVINCYGMFSITGEQTTTESAYWSWIKYYHKETTQGEDRTGLMDALRWAETKGHTTGSEMPVKATAEYYIFHCAKRKTGGVTTVIHPELDGLVYSETGTIGIDMDITGGTLANAGYYIEWDSDEFVGRKQVLFYYMQVFRVRASKVGSDNKIAYSGWIYYGYNESTPNIWELTTSSGSPIALDRQTFGAYLDEYHD